VLVAAGSKSGLIWETRNSPADYQLDSLSPEVYNTLLAGHIQVGVDTFGTHREVGGHIGSSRK
jgi:hypothetical protein